MPPEKTICIPYTGPSMNPTFRAGDLLHVVPVKESDLRRGDVILYRPPGKDKKITHRVSALTPEGAKTKGDANSRIDDYLIRQENLIGRVNCVNRRGRIKVVIGGPPGLACAVFARLTVKLNRNAAILFHYPYRKLSNLHIFCNLPFVRSKIKVVSYRRGGGEERQVLFGSRPIGRLLPGEDKWKFKKPFRLLADERLLNDEIKKK